MIVYDDTNKPIGQLVNGELEPLDPAPTGEALADLLDDVCHRIEMHPRLGVSSRLAANLRPTKGQRSLLLMYGIFSPIFLNDDGTPNPQCQRFGGGVQGWIVDGTLRSFEQIAPVLTEYADMMETKC